MRLLTSIALCLAISPAPAWADTPRPRGNVVRVEHRPADRNPTLGPSDAPVTAELFFTPGQIDSNRAYRRLVELQSRHPRRLRVVFRVVERTAQVVVPIAALEAYAQGKFAAFMDAVTATRAGTVRRDSLDAIADTAGLDKVRLDAALDRALDVEPPSIADNERRRLRRHGANVPELLLNGLRIGQTLAALDTDDLETYYQAAYEHAEEMLSDGVPADHLIDAAERDDAPETAIASYPAGPLDDPQPIDDQPDGPPPLLDRPLDLTGLPSDGDDDAPVEITVLCDLALDSCRLQLDVARKLLDLYPHQVRVTWYPYFDPAADDAGLARLHRAALCADGAGDWTWIDEEQRQVRAGVVGVDALIETASRLAGTDARSLGACLAAGDDRDLHARVEAAQAAGVRHGPALVIGGRVYQGGFTDWHAAAPIVDQELAPGLLERMVPSWDPPETP